MVNKKQKKLILICLAVLLVVLIILIVVKASLGGKNNVENNETTSNSVVNNKNNDELIRKLKRVSESERIRIYLGTYFKYLEEKKYEGAYNLLYPEFRNNYFPKLEDFENYIKKQNLPEIFRITYADISMQGQYYLVTVKLGDMNSPSTTTDMTINLIIQENDYNDFYISFQK